METIWVLAMQWWICCRRRGQTAAMSWRRTGQRRGRGARLGGRSAFIGRVGDDPFGHLCKKRLRMSRLIQNGCGWTRSIAPPRWWWISITTVNVPLPLWFARALIYSSTPADLPSFRAGEWLHVCSIALSAEPSRSATFLAMAAIRQAGDSSALIPIFAPISGTMKSSCVSVLSGH